MASPLGLVVVFLMVALAVDAPALELASALSPPPAHTPSPGAAAPVPAPGPAPPSSPEAAATTPARAPSSQPSPAFAPKSPPPTPCSPPSPADGAPPPAPSSATSPAAAPKPAPPTSSSSPSLADAAPPGGPSSSPSPAAAAPPGGPSSSPSPAAAAPCPCAAPTPAPAPSPPTEPRCRWSWKLLGKAGFVFAAIGMMINAIPWFVFRKMTPEDWRKQQFDSFSEWTLWIDVFSSFCTLLLHLLFFERRNLDTIFTEASGICFGMQQINFIHEKKATANPNYMRFKRTITGRYMLGFSFWGFLILLCLFFYKLENDAPIPHSKGVIGVIKLVHVAAMFFKCVATVAPFISRCIADNWERDSDASIWGKYLSAVLQIISSAYDSWNYGCNGLYWTKGHGPREALILACTSTVCGFLLLVGRWIGPRNSRKLGRWIQRGWAFVTNKPLLLTYSSDQGTDPQPDPPTSPEDIIQGLQNKITDKENEIKELLQTLEKQGKEYLELQQLHWKQHKDILSHIDSYAGKVKDMFKEQILEKQKHSMIVEKLLEGQRHAKKVEENQSQKLLDFEGQIDIFEKIIEEQRQGLQGHAKVEEKLRVVEGQVDILEKTIVEQRQELQGHAKVEADLKEKLLAVEGQVDILEKTMEEQLQELQGNQQLINEHRQLLHEKIGEIEGPIQGEAEKTLASLSQNMNEVLDIFQLMQDKVGEGE